MKGKLYEECIGTGGSFPYPQHIRKMLDEARESFPMLDKIGKPIHSKALEWFKKWFGDEERIDAVLDGYLVLQLTAHLRDGRE